MQVKDMAGDQQGSIAGKAATCDTGIPVDVASSLAAPLPIQLLLMIWEKLQRMAQILGSLRSFWESWMWFLASAVAIIWGMKHWMEDLSL